MAFVTPYTEELTPIREYLVKIDGIYKDTIEHGTLMLHRPSNIFNETNGLCEEGVVVKAPLIDGLEEDIVGKKVRFWFTEAHATYRGNMPKIDGHLMVMPQSIISVDDEMIGEYIFCKPIETARSSSGLIVPNIEYVSYDTLQKPVQNIREFYTDRGKVSGKNKHYPEGEIIWWGHESNVRLGWNGGFLVRRRMLEVHGPDAQRLDYVKVKPRRMA
jgi:hypothetical protein